MNNLDLRALDGEKILVTGATGLIGKNLIKYLIANTGAEIIAQIRNEEKANAIFTESEQKRIRYLIGDIRDIRSENMGIGYIVHGASMTSSKAFVDTPVEVMETAIEGTKAVLNFAKANPVKSMVYLSTMEVYGTPETDEKIDESHGTNLLACKARSGYPLSKLLCENMCAAYLKEFGLSTKVVRLTQTFGKGVAYDDGRVFAEFARCAIEKRDIVLKTKGETKRCYLYTEDAAKAILTVLLNGADGEAYNAANEETYCSIYEMAELVAEECAAGKIKVVIEEQDCSKLGFAPVLRMNLDTRKLQALGWSAETDLQTMYTRMIEDMSAHE